MTRAVLLALLLAGCGTDAAIVRELEDAARRHPRPEFDRILDAREPVRVRDAKGPVTLPLLPRRLPTVEGAFNGVAMDVLVDSGCTHVALPARLAREAGVYLPAREPAAVISPRRDAAYRLCAFRSVALGPLRFGGGNGFVPVPSDDARRAIVGNSVLSHFVVTFDFKRRELRLEPHGGPGYAQVLFTTVELDGRPYVMLVDSGAASLTLEPRVAKELGVTGEWGRVGRVRVAGREFTDVRCRVIATFEGVAGEAAGLLGLAGFGKNVWKLDYGTKRLTLED